MLVLSTRKATVLHKWDLAKWLERLAVSFSSFPINQRTHTLKSFFILVNIVNLCLFLNKYAVMPKLQQSWVRSQHPPTQWNGRWSIVELRTLKEKKTFFTVQKLAYRIFVFVENCLLEFFNDSLSLLWRASFKFAHFTHTWGQATVVSGSFDVIGKIARSTQKQTHNQGTGYLFNELYVTKKTNLDVDAREKAWVHKSTRPYLPCVS